MRRRVAALLVGDRAGQQVRIALADRRWIQLPQPACAEGVRVECAGFDRRADVFQPRRKVLSEALAAIGYESPQVLISATLSSSARASAFVGP